MRPARAGSDRRAPATFDNGPVAIITTSEGPLRIESARSCVALTGAGCGLQAAREHTGQHPLDGEPDLRWGDGDCRRGTVRHRHSYCRRNCG
jgi:hypothetical protein